MGLPLRNFGSIGWELTDGWRDAAGLQLGDDDLDTISAAIASTGAGSGPSRPAVIGVV